MKPRIRTVEKLAVYTCQTPQTRRWWKRYANKQWRRDSRELLEDAPKKRAIRGWQD